MKESLFGKLIMVIDESVRVWVRRIFNEQSKLIPVSKDELRILVGTATDSYANAADYSCFKAVGRSCPRRPFLPQSHRFLIQAAYSWSEPPAPATCHRFLRELHRMV
jgi:hypothetical protein